MVGLVLTAGVLVAALLLPLVGGLGLATNRASDLVEQTSGELAKADLPLMTTVLDNAGTPIAYFYDQYRLPTPSEQISKAMKVALVSVEDKRFYEHNGVDPKGIGRALVKGSSGDGMTQGASTLTQQYIKNYLVYAIGNGDRESFKKATKQTPGRKLKEARIALDLEQRLTQEAGGDKRRAKDQILTSYLNIVPFGNSIFGVGAAARTYFNTTPDKLTVPQAALLVALANKPILLDPGESRDEAKKRRNTLIDTMQANGAFGEDKAKAEQDANRYKESDLGVTDKVTRPQSGCIGAGNLPVDGYFCSYLFDYLQKSGLPKDRIMRGGLTIKTTLDRRANDAAHQAAARQAPPDTAEGIANAMAVVQPGGERHKVIALAANKEFGNEAGQSAWELPSMVTNFGAGSIYKVFTSAAALEQHASGILQQLDNPQEHVSSVFKNGTRPYKVTNFGHYPDKMTMQDALAQSPNTAFIKLEEKVGVRAAVDMAAKLGMRETTQYKAPGQDTPLGERFKRDNSGSFTLGPDATSVLELANVAATLMSGGKWCPPTPVVQVLDRDNRPVQLNEPACEQVVPTELANTLVQGMSKDDKPGGTSSGAAGAAGWDRPILGKTGTTETSQSVAFMAATPQYAGAVMTFSDGGNPQTICPGPLRLCGNRSQGGVTGGHVAAPTWFDAMKVIHQGLPVQQLPPADPRYS
ncbi:penicillin-binding protein [Solihabitans fulvus]|uniref:Penicillin-binding protein n=1 Tax=Solihabitans fulvus TaxID=1892852 RepID=A0A5B2WQ84_9PSEU|nr:penicillin-binding protein [Solihabitans fulvus]